MSGCNHAPAFPMEGGGMGAKSKLKGGLQATETDTHLHERVSPVQQPEALHQAWQVGWVGRLNCHAHDGRSLVQQERDSRYRI